MSIFMVSIRPILTDNDKRLLVLLFIIMLLLVSLLLSVIQHRINLPVCDWGNVYFKSNTTNLQIKTTKMQTAKQIEYHDQKMTDFLNKNKFPMIVSEVMLKFKVRNKTKTITLFENSKK